MATKDQVKNAKKESKFALSSEDTTLKKSEEGSLLDYISDFTSIMEMVSEIGDPFGVCGVIGMGKDILGRIAKIRENQQKMRRLAHDITSLAPILVTISKNFNLMSVDKQNTLQPAIRTLYHDFESIQAFTERVANHKNQKTSLLKKIVNTLQDISTTEKIEGEIRDHSANLMKSMQILSLGMNVTNSVEQQMRDSDAYEEEAAPDPFDYIMDIIDEESGERLDEGVKFINDEVDRNLGTSSYRSYLVFMHAMIHCKKGANVKMWQCLDDAAARGFSDTEFIDSCKKKYFITPGGIKTKADEAKFAAFVKKVEVNHKNQFRYMETLTEEKIDFYTLVFDAYDADHSQKIDQNEFRALMKAANQGLTRKQIDDFLKRIDESGDSEIEIDEWLNLMADINANPSMFPGLDPELSFFKKSKDERKAAQEAAKEEFIPVGKGKGKKAGKKMVESSDDEEEPVKEVKKKKVVASKAAASKKKKDESESESESEDEKSKKKDKGKEKDKKGDKKGDKGKEKDKGDKKGDKDKKKKKK